MKAIIRVENEKVTDIRKGELLAELSPKARELFEVDYIDYIGTIPEGTFFKFVDDEIIIDGAKEAEQAQKVINQEARAYLKTTDEWAIREWETAKPMPDGMRALRAEARAKVI